MNPGDTAWTPSRCESTATSLNEGRDVNGPRPALPLLPQESVRLTFPGIRAHPCPPSSGAAPPGPAVAGTPARVSTDAQMQKLRAYFDR